VPHREFVKDLEAARPSAIIDLIHSAEVLQISALAHKDMPAPGTCERCNYISSQPVCKA
jgi:cytoplasmic tRNA 2-thiolation protein 1